MRKVRRLRACEAEIAELDVKVGSQELEDPQSDYKKQVQGYEGAKRATGKPAE